MMWVSYFSYLILAVYAGQVLYMLISLKKSKDESVDVYDDLVTVIVVARNEEDSIGECIRSILNQTHQNLELIIADDASTDYTHDIIKKHEALDKRLSYISLPDSEFPQKKAGVEKAVRLARSEFILLTDADCIHDSDWIKCMLFEFKRGYKIVCGPVRIEDSNFFQKLQALEFAGLIGVTSASIEKSQPVMCNAANLGFSKKTFIETGGYSLNRSVASGDDMFLLQQISARYPGSVGFSNNVKAIVTTHASPDLSSFISQRVRWITKMKFVKPSSLAIFIGLSVMSINLILIILSGFSFFSDNFAILFCEILSGKIILNGIFFYRSAGNLKQKHLIWLVPLLELVYLPYVVMLIFGSIRGNYNWKNREVRI